MEKNRNGVSGDMLNMYPGDATFAKAIWYLVHSPDRVINSMTFKTIQDIDLDSVAEPLREAYAEYREAALELRDLIERNKTNTLEIIDAVSFPLKTGDGQGVLSALQPRFSFLLFVAREILWEENNFPHLDSPRNL